MAKVTNVHFMGAGGSGISGVYFLAQKMGFKVDGCDLDKESSYTEGFINGHDATHVKHADLVVASPAIFYQSAKHPEFLEAKKSGKLVTWQHFLGEYIHKGKSVICVAGTHGKSTTTAMIGKLLEDALLDPAVVIGAKVPLWEKNARFGKGKYFVTEADEFFDNFLNYSPEYIVLNNIEFDHPDYFKSEESVYESFLKFINRLVGKKVLILNAEDPGIEKIRDRFPKDIKIIEYSNSKNNIDFNLLVPGEFNRQNALGVIELGKELGISQKVIKKSLESFTGIGRRLEKIGTKDGIEIYDDYAHHPTAVSKTIKALSDRYPGKRIWVVVEPHGFERTHSLLAKYRGAFENAYGVIIGPIFKARDTETFGVSSESIVEISGHKNIKSAKDFDTISASLKSEAREGDIILVMGAGKSYIWARNLLNN